MDGSSHRTEHPSDREDDEVVQEILRDMLLVSREELWELPRGTTPLKSLDDAAYESGKLTLDERDAVYRRFLRQRVEEMQVQLLGSSFGSYHIVEVIAAGGMGIVFKARQESPMFTRDVAMKFMISGTSTTEADRERFMSEVKGLAGLSHPSLVSIFDSGIKDHLYYFTMELIDGPSLRDLTGETSLGVLRRVEIVRDVARALAYLHENGVVHRDVKPGNIMVDREGVTKLLDFGIAQFSADARKRGIQAGTLHYMAPEIIDPSGSFGSIGPGADIYALGAVLYYLLYGVEVFSGSTTPTDILESTLGEAPRFPRERRREVGAGLERIVRKALSKHVDERHPTAADLAESLDRYLLRRRSRGPVLTIAAVLMVALTILTISLGSRDGDLPEPKRILSLEHGERLDADLANIEKVATGGDAGVVDELRQDLQRLAKETGQEAFDELYTALKEKRTEFWQEKVQGIRQKADVAWENLHNLIEKERLHLDVDFFMKLHERAIEKMEKPETKVAGFTAYSSLQDALSHLETAIRTVETVRDQERELRELRSKVNTVYRTAMDASRVEKDALRLSPQAQADRKDASEKLARARSDLELATETRAFEETRRALVDARTGFEAAITGFGLAQERAGKARKEFDTLKKGLLEGRKQAGIRFAEITSTLSQNDAAEFETLSRSHSDLLQMPVDSIEEGKGFERSLKDFSKAIEEAGELLADLRSQAESREEEARTLRRELDRAAAHGLPADDLPRLQGEADRELEAGRNDLVEKKYVAAARTFGKVAKTYRDLVSSVKKRIDNTIWVPPGSVDGPDVISGFYVDRYEVSVGDWRRFLDHVTRKGHGDCCPDEKRTRNHLPRDWNAQRSREDLPVVGVGLEDARAYARFRGKAIPTVHEWRLAAQRDGEGNLKLHSGGVFDATKINGRGTAGEDKYVALAPVDTALGLSPGGCHHMVGNAAEWAVLPDGTGALMGGCFRSGGPNLRLDTTMKLSELGDPELYLPLAGFRCIVRVGKE